MIVTDIKNINKNTVKFTLKNANIAIANALRRIMIAELETFAVDSIDIIDNTSIFPSEMVAHRLGLIPVQCTEPTTFELNVSNTTDEILTVYSDSIVSTASFPYNIPILKLGKNQSIHIKGIITSGIGKTHAKYCPVSNSTYTYDTSTSDPVNFTFTVESIIENPMKLFKKSVDVLVEQLVKVCQVKIIS